MTTMILEEPSHKEVIERSWQRCRAVGLEHDSAPTIKISTRGDFTASLDKNQSLLETTQHKVLPYYENLLANSNCLVMLADNSGQILNTWGKQRSYLEKHKQLFSKGVYWHENLVGTNAIGTTLATGSIVQISHNEHYLQANRFMTGSAAPIYDVDRQMLGVIDISSDTYMPQAHTLGMVKLMSLAVGNQLIKSRYHDDHFLLWFNTSPENIDSQWSALLVFDEHGTIITANRRAEIVLGMDLSYQNVSTLFNISLKQLLSHSAQFPLPITTPQNVHFYGFLLPPKQPSARTLNFIPAVTTEVEEKKQQPSPPTKLSLLDMGDPTIAKAIKQTVKIINKDIPILINGETGVGKEVFVKALHEASDRSGSNLVAVNCAAIPDDLVESELFGYVKGAFTGANSKGYIGLIRKANKGTLFLDEIGDMPLNVQTRMLRVLQERKVTPLGSTESYSVDFKLISATHRYLKTDVEAGSFRQDLFYRVSGLNITLPPLRERCDKEALIRHLIAYHSEPGSQGEIAMEVLTAFKFHPWPGNIRQMVSVIQIALAMAEDNQIELDNLPDDFFDDLNQQDLANGSTMRGVDSDKLSYHPESGESAINAETSIGQGDWLATYNQYDRNVSKTAKALGVSRNTLYKKLRDSGLK
jgi:transcriptional regulator of acetoin/glycerol metabolism